MATVNMAAWVSESAGRAEVLSVCMDTDAAEPTLVRHSVADSTPLRAALHSH